MLNKSILHYGIFIMLCIMNVFAETPEKVTDSNNTFELSPRVLFERSKRFEQCGVDSVFTILRWYSQKVPMTDVINSVPARVFQKGMNISEFKELLEAYSLAYKELHGKPNSVKKQFIKQSVLLVPNDQAKHVYLYLRQNKDKYLRYNPPYDIKWVDEDRFYKDWEGYGLIINETPVWRDAVRTSWVCFPNFEGVK